MQVSLVTKTILVVGPWAVSGRFPLINSVVQKINLRKRRDSLILGGVIAVCVIVLLLLAFRWNSESQHAPCILLYLSWREGDSQTLAGQECLTSCHKCKWLLVTGAWRRAIPRTFLPFYIGTSNSILRIGVLEVYLSWLLLCLWAWFWRLLWSIHNLTKNDSTRNQVSLIWP